MLAIPTVLVLFFLGPLVLGGFITVLVVPTVYLALRSKIKDPEGLPGAVAAPPQQTQG